MSTYKQSGWSERAGSRFPGGSSGGGKESNGGHHENYGGIRVHGQKVTGFRHRRFGRNWKACVLKGFRFVFPAVAMLMVMVFVFFFLDTREDLSLNEKSAYDPLDFFSNSTYTNTPFKKLNFGRGSGSIGRDSRYWDRDDRRRDSDYDEDALTHLVNDIASVVSNQQGAKITKRRGLDDSSRREFDVSGTHSILPEGSHGGSSTRFHQIPKNNYLYNEYGRKELRHYEAEYEASLNGSNHSDENSANRSTHSTNKPVANQGQAYYEKREAGFDTDPVDFDDEYDDGVDMQENHGEFAMDSDRKSTNFGVTTASTNGDLDMENNSNLFSEKADGSSSKPRIVGGVKGDSSRRTNSAIKSSLKRKGKRRKFAGPPCGMKLLDSSALSVEPIENKKFARFSLQYTEFEGVPFGQQNWKPRFAGHQTLEEREQSFYAQNKKIHCGFVKAPKGLPGTGFDLAENDLKFMSSCHIAVSSCIFGNSDNLRTPMQSVVSRLSRKTVCFVMFVDEDTLQTLSSEGQKPDPAGYIGFWRIVVVRNLPYPDMRRVGKIPKLLAHRLFRSARYSIWLDSKLRLQSDPLLLLEYFLWRKGYEYAISNHYDRHCVWEEVAQNKKLNKFNHTVIDEQFMFYQADGLKRFNVSDPNKLLPSYVPEGSFIIRAHTPMSNLFSCLWFNEVDRFTPRDQLSFAYTYLKLRRMNPEKPFYLNMFKDCERRSIAKLFHHRAEEKRNLPLEAKE